MNPTRALALIRQHCSTSAVPEWRDEITRRQRRSPQPIPRDRAIMRHLCIAIAYSQGARSALIYALLDSSAFKSACSGFDPVALSRRDPRQILRRHWSQLGALRFKGKILRIVSCARVLNGIILDSGSFANYLKNFGIPRRIRSKTDLDAFWIGFDALQRDLRRRQMPFFRSTTSLLQLLLDLDYDSVKPDLIVMRLARRIGIVVRETGDPAFRQCVRFLQDYSITHQCRAAELDLALLAFGGQTGASQMLPEKFCPASDPCRHPTCPLSRNRLCMAHLKGQKLAKRNK